MFNLRIEFLHPWHLLLLIPALALTLIPYFLLSKKYRRTRNRITSMVLHLLIMLLAITTFAGMLFKYDIQNEENVILYLVDVSHSEENASMERDEFLEKALEYSRFDGYTVGVVTFGFDQELAVDFTTDVDEIFKQYEDAEKPDTTATNIADALRYSKELLADYKIAKIVLVTDGLETDEEANSVIKSIASLGIRLDVAYIPVSDLGVDVQISKVEYPDYHVSVGDDCAISVTIQSTQETDITVELYDNGKPNPEATKAMTVGQGTQDITFTHVFEEDGLHNIDFKISKADVYTENNTHTSYYYLQEFDQILILESNSGESERLKNSLIDKEGVKYDVDVQMISSAPMNVDELREYDQIILNNIAAKDMPLGFDVALEMYVKDFGGGVFTVGGNNEDGSAHAYNRKDMYNTLYQQILPVQAINYTQPCAVMIILDTSGSMTGGSADDLTKLDWAKAGASQCVDMLSERDYVGIMTLSTEYEMKQDLIPCTQKNKIHFQINSLGDAAGMTNYGPSIEKAGLALSTVDVEKRHIIIVSDGYPSDPLVTEGDMIGYGGYIRDNYENHGITLSIMAIGLSSSSSEYVELEQAVKLGHGFLYNPEPGGEIIEQMRKDMNIQAIKESTEDEFKPVLDTVTSPITSGIEYTTEGSKNYMTVDLNGYYGVRAKKTADVLVQGPYGVPLYAQWKYGKGMVGSFMSDLNGNWSSEFMDDVNGKTLIYNIVKGLMPTESIRPNEFKVNLTEDNYTNRLSIITNLENGEYVSGKVYEIVDGAVAEETAVSLNEITQGNKQALREMNVFVKTALDVTNNYSRCDLIIKARGVYKIVLEKRSADGNVLASYETYKTFAYSEEYDTYLEETEIRPLDFLKALSEKTGGKVIEDLENPEEIFEDFVTALTYTFDPRILFMILVIIFFLTDIAVRKFKFKWPHELIQAWKEKQNSK